MNSHQFASVGLSNEINANVKIITSNRSKRISLKANLDGIYIIVPGSTSHHEIITFIESKREWISKSLIYFEKITRGLDPALIQSSKVLFLGEPYDIQAVRDKICYVILSESLKRITVHSPNSDKRKKTMVDFYHQHTARILGERIEVLASKLNLDFNHISIRHHRSKWGSCSVKKNLSFNTMLSALPSNVIDYVIIHELLHLLELNHSKRFWELIRLNRPTYEYERKWLQMYGPFIRVP
jgi:predicted metal-dependent hydrolase